MENAFKQPSVISVNFLEASANYNILKVEDHFVAAAKSLGPVDLSSEGLTKLDLPPNTIITGAPMEEVRKKIKAADSELKK